MMKLESLMMSSVTKTYLDYSSEPWALITILMMRSFGSALNSKKMLQFFSLGKNYSNLLLVLKDPSDSG